MKNLPNTLFEVKAKDSEVIILCYLSGKMRKHYIKILPGDKVRFVAEKVNGALTVTELESVK